MPENGPFVWHELRAPDLEQAVRFYGAVFGWAFPDNPMGRSITHRGVVIGGASAVKVGLDALHRVQGRRRGGGASRRRGRHRHHRTARRRLPTADVAAAAEFYAATFGWRVTVGDGGAVVDADGLRVAELVPDDGVTGWLPFVRVEDLAEACHRIVALGGAAEEPVLWQGTAGYALARDPQGVAFAVHAE